MQSNPDHQSTHNSRPALFCTATYGECRLIHGDPSINVRGHANVGMQVSTKQDLELQLSFAFPTLKSTEKRK